MRLVRLLAASIAAFLFSFSLTASAQTTPPAAPLSQDQLDGLLAPIALYPDQLLTQVLIASTYPLEVVEAARFVKANPALRGQALDDALRDKTWDASVLSLAAFPQILDMMNEHLEWMQRLGDAFLADEAAVMGTVQSLRQRAQQAGNLQSTEQQRVLFQDSYIVIEPAQPQYVYVPVYNPTIIYGPWWAPAYLPWYWYPPPIWGYPPVPPGWGYTAGFFWGTAWAIGYNNWGWARPNWYNRSININVGNNYWLNRPQSRARYPGGSGNWNHAPEHRRGVAYRDPVTSNRYRPTNPAAVQSRESYRGRDQVPTTRPMPSLPPGGQAVTRPMPSSPPGGQAVTRPTAPSTTARQTTRPMPSPSASQPMARPMPSSPSGQPTTRPMPGPSPGGQPAARPAPTYQTPSRPQVQMESSRGQMSRQTMNMPAPSAGRAAPPAGHPAAQPR